MQARRMPEQIIVFQQCSHRAYLSLNILIIKENNSQIAILYGGF
jgi:putative lipoic acid-binding regulatory protein